MSPRLRQLLMVVGSVGVLGSAGLVGYFVVGPRPGASNAELIDAGILEAPRAQMRCRVRVEDECRDLPDGGRRPRYLTMRGEVAVLDRDGGRDAIVSRWVPRGAADCIERLACEFLEEDGCTDETYCDGVLGGRVEQHRGACARTDAGPCRIRMEDGGLRAAPIGNVLPPGLWQGPGCFRVFEGPTLAGEYAPLPEECAQ